MRRVGGNSEELVLGEKQELRQRKEVKADEEVQNDSGLTGGMYIGSLVCGEPVIRRHERRCGAGKRDL